jgi:glutamine synthetase
MPKPIFQDNGSGMHTHQSLWKAGKNVFYDAKNYALISDTARHYVGGILRHAHALCAFVAPTTNSYRRLVPGYEAPINIVYSQRNRSAAVRIPMYSPSEKSKRLEFRTPDPSCNPYYAFAAMLMAGLDGIANKTEPPPPIDKNLYDLRRRKRRRSSRCRVPWTKRCMHWSRTTPSCSRATSSPVMLSRRGSPTSARKSWMRSG